MRVFTPSAAKQLALAPVDVRRSDPRTGEEVRAWARTCIRWSGRVNRVARLTVRVCVCVHTTITDPERGGDPGGRDARAVRRQGGYVRGVDGQQLCHGNLFAGYPVTPRHNQGKYGVAIVWSDGHYATIYTFDALEKVAARVAAEAAAGGGM